MFQVGTDELIAPTASGWDLQDNDWIEVDPILGNRDLRAGDMVLALFQSDLTLLEIRSLVPGNDEVRSQ